MSDEEEESCDCPAGIPAWVMTFADLMSLLMCFFVLLLSFSEMDVLKFKQLAGSMREAFGVQNRVKAQDIPKGTSIIAQEFSPAQPEPTPLNVVRQMTTDLTKSSLYVDCQDEAQRERNKDASSKYKEAKRLAQEQQDTPQPEMDRTANELAAALSDAIERGDIDIETREKLVIIRIKERGAFGRGEGELKPEFIGIMNKMREVLERTPGYIRVIGHTDNVPSAGGKYRSNWELSAVRAVSVAHELLVHGTIDERRIAVQGKADTEPVAPNDSEDNRILNRRVEVMIEQGKDKKNKDPLESLDREQMEKYERLRKRSYQRFDVDPDDIF